jgi:peptide deformylase
MSDPILLLGDAALRASNAPVEHFDTELADIAQRLSETLTDTPQGAAVAASQIGVNKRLFVWRATAKSEHQVVVNPRILSQSEEQWSYKEGCLSIPDMWWYLRRPRHIQVGYQDLKGNTTTTTLSDFEGRLYQHEFDHCEGKLLLDILVPGELKRARKALLKKGLVDGGS